VKKNDTMLMRSLLQLGSRASLFTAKKDALQNREGNWQGRKRNRKVPFFT
jgi:hypothetical protein